MRPFRFKNHKAALSVIECRFQFLDVKFLHLPQLGHHGFFFLLVLSRVPLIKVGGRDLPANAEFVDHPAAFHGLATTGGEFFPVVVNLVLSFAWHDK